TRRRVQGRQCNARTKYLRITRPACCSYLSNHTCDNATLCPQNLSPSPLALRSALQRARRDAAREQRRLLRLRKGRLKQVRVLLPQAKQRQNIAHPLLEVGPIQRLDIHQRAGVYGTALKQGAEAVLEPVAHGRLPIETECIVPVEQGCQGRIRNGLQHRWQ